MIFKWLKKKLGIKELENKNIQLSTLLQYHKDYVDDKIREIEKNTRVDADIGFRGNNTIIITGVYRNKGYVKFYDVGDGQFQMLVEQLRDLNKHCMVRNIDKPPSFHGTFDIF